jgi:aminopeptidase N
MAHMWFGDLVTMQWWDDLWLNESFATFASVLCQAEATEYTEAWTTFANVEKSWAYRQDQLPSTHPVAADIPDLAAVEVNFDGITYAKGASVLKQLVAYVGLEEFLSGLRDYFRDPQPSPTPPSATTRRAGEGVGPRPVRLGDSSGSRQLGSTRFDPTSTSDADGRFNRFSISQSGAQPGAGETRVHRLAVGITTTTAAARLVRTRREELDVEGSTTDVPELQRFHAAKLILSMTTT